MQRGRGDDKREKGRGKERARQKERKKWQHIIEVISKILHSTGQNTTTEQRSGKEIIFFVIQQKP